MKLVRFATLMLAVFLGTAVSFGQGRGSAGAGSSGGGSTFGGGGLSSGGFGSSSFGSGLGGGFGSSGFGGGGMGGGFGGQGGGIGSPGAQMGMNFGDNQSFIGSDSAQIRDSLERMGRNSDRMTQSIERATSRRRDRDRDNQNSQNQALPIRIQLKVAFDHPPISSTAVPTMVTQRLTKIVGAKKISMPNVEFRDGVITLTGPVPTASDRLLIEKLVSLEPGVTRVVNQMIVPEEIAAPIPPQ